MYEDPDLDMDERDAQGVQDTPKYTLAQIKEAAKDARFLASEGYCRSLCEEAREAVRLDDKDWAHHPDLKGLDTWQDKANYYRMFLTKSKTYIESELVYAMLPPTREGPIDYREESVEDESIWY